MRAYYMDSSAEDQRAPHEQDPPAPCSLEALAAIGVLYWRLDAAIAPDANAELSAIRAARGYTYTDLITLSPEKLPNYEAKLKIFFTEHLHTDEEIRFCLEGGGYFDVRDAADRWLRVSVRPGDLIVLPAGMFHRFTLDEGNYGKFMRLFVGEPVWTPYNRADEGTAAMAARDAYVKQFLAPLQAAAE